MNNNVFELAKSVDIKRYLQSKYGFEFKNNKILCPFHREKNPSFAVYPPKQTVTCFSGCGWNDGKDTGDIIHFVSKHEGISRLNAARQICDDYGITYRRDEKKYDSNNEQRDRRMIENDQGKQTNQQMKEKSKILVDKATLHKEEFEKELGDIIVHKIKLPDDWKNCYLGWDDEEKSIVIVNQSKVTGQVWNIKHKKKRGFDGKWISYPRSQAFPFPIDYFRQHKDNRVIICEGEKDALNLLTIGVNCLTLGGAATSWHKHKHLLDGKDVYICFDNDQTGYDNAIRRYDEIKGTANSVSLVLFCCLETKISDHYDISDLIKDHCVSNCDEFFGLLSKCSFADKGEAIKIIEQRYKYKNIIEAVSSQGDLKQSEAKDVEIEWVKDRLWKISSMLLLIPIIMITISLSVHKSLPYEFYTLTRVLHFSVFALVAVFSYKKKDIVFSIIFAILAFLFNPLHPFFLTRNLWVIIDWFVIAIVCYYLFVRMRVLNKIFDHGKKN